MDAPWAIPYTGSPLSMNFWVFIYRAGWVALLILILIGLSAVFTPQIKQYHELRRKEAAIQEDIRLEDEILQHLRDQQEKLQSDPRFVEKVAREELGYAKPGETVFRFVDEEPQTRPAP